MVLILATGAFAVLAIVGFLWRLSQLARRFPRGSRGRLVALTYAGATAAFGAFVIWLIVGWVQQSLNPLATGHPGPVVLLLFVVAAAIACVPSMVGIALMSRVLNRRRGVGENAEPGAV